MNQIIKRNPAVIWKEIEGEIVLLNPKKGDYFGLEAVGAAFWELIDDKTDRDSIIRILLEGYDVEEDILKKDISALINTMQQKKLIEVI